MEHPVVAGDGEDREEGRHVEADPELGLVAVRVGARGRAFDVAAAAVGPRLVEHLHGAVRVQRVGGARVGARLGLEPGREARDLVPPPSVPLQVQVPHHPHGGHRGGGGRWRGFSRGKRKEAWRWVGMPGAGCECECVRRVGTGYTTAARPIAGDVEDCGRYVLGAACSVRLAVVVFSLGYGPGCCRGLVGCDAMRCDAIRRVGVSFLLFSVLWRLWSSRVQACGSDLRRKALLCQPARVPG